MKTITPKYPWCTGAPRPTLIANQDAQEALVSYYTAPVCHPVCKTAVLKMTGVICLESRYVNDEQNTFLKSGLLRDLIHVKTRGTTHEYIFLFHNEWIKVTAAALEEFPGGASLWENIRSHYNSDFDRD